MDNVVDFKLSRVERLLFTLLKIGFSKSEEIPADAYFDSVTAAEWVECYKLACTHGVMALAWDGVVKLPKNQQPPLSVKVPWALAVEEYEKKYLRYCRTIEELSLLYKENNIATVQLKGVGLSSYYPVPKHREGGDIDIYTFAAESLCSGPKCGYLFDEKRDKEANELADDLMEKAGIEVEKHSYKHSNFYYKGIPFENHKSFLNVEEYRYARDVDKYLKGNLNPQAILLDGCSNQILIPSLEFNSVFVPFHAFQHYGTGLSLHHLCDWAMIVEKGGLDVWPEEIKDNRFLTGIAAFTLLSDNLLGTQSALSEKENTLFASVAGEKKVVGLARNILQEMLYPPYLKDVPVKGKLKILHYKTGRFLHRNRLLKDVFEFSIMMNIWKSIIAHIRVPKTIFK